MARIAYEKARRAATTRTYDYVGSYVSDLGSVVDMEMIRSAKLKIGVDPLGGASVAYWRPIVEHYGVQVEMVNDTVDPTFRFMPLDWDGKIRMDCSSPYAMAKLIALKDRFDIAFGNDTDSDRHGIVTRSAGLMNPNHYLAAAIFYLFTHRPGWRKDAAIGKTVVSSSVIDRVAAKVGRALVEVPVGFKWFVPGLLDGSLGFGGEESAGASFLGATEPCGRPTRTASSWIFLPWSSWRAPAAIRPSFTMTLPASSARRSMSASMRRPRQNKKRCSSSSRRTMSKQPSLPVTRFGRSSQPRLATAQPLAA